MIQLNMNLRCPHCGQSMPPKVLVSGYIRPQIVDVIAQRSSSGVTLQQVADIVYSTAIDQPRTRKSVWLLIRLANRELKPQGYQIVPLFRGPGARWVMREIDADPKREPAGDPHPRSVERAQPTRTPWVD